jgi:plasmid maintenance system antidote protein VapI
MNSSRKKQTRKVPRPNITREQAKEILKQRGWQYRTVAPILGCSYQHLSEVLNGHRNSFRILREIETLATAN